MTCGIRRNQQSRCPPGDTHDAAGLRVADSAARPPPAPQVEIPSNRRPAGIMMIMTRSEGGTVTVTVTGVELPARWAGLGPRPYQPPDSY